MAATSCGSRSRIEIRSRHQKPPLAGGCGAWVVLNG